MTLVEARGRAGLTQDELAAQSGIDQTTISGLETGRKRSPKFDTVIRLSKVLGISPEQLRFGTIDRHEAKAS
jgi:transcriptional regulator with XRE-family HTH domain